MILCRVSRRENENLSSSTTLVHEEQLYEALCPRKQCLLHRQHAPSARAKTEHLVIFALERDNSSHRAKGPCTIARK